MTTIIYKENRLYADHRATSTLAPSHFYNKCGGNQVACDTQDKIFYKDLDSFKYLDYPLRAMVATGDMGLVNLISHLIRREDGRSFVHTLAVMGEVGMHASWTGAQVMLLTDRTLFCYEISGFAVKKQELFQLKDLEGKFMAMGSGAALATFGIQIMGLNPVEAIQFASLGDEFTSSSVTEVSFHETFHPTKQIHEGLAPHELVAKFLHDKKLLSDKIVTLTKENGFSLESLSPPGPLS